MQCSNPKPFTATSDVLTRGYHIFIPCGKCYACQCNSRAEWALRMKYEFNDKRIVSKFFITLSYDDAHLPCVGYNTETVLSYYSHLPISRRNYWFSVLDQSHASMFIESLKHWFRKWFVKPLYYVNPHTGECSETPVKVYDPIAEKYFNAPPKGYIAVYDDNTLPRYYLTGEYGDISNRTHMHAILLFPAVVHKADLLLYSQFLWPFGKMDVQDSISAAAQNYVAKHQVKDCLGTSFQNLISPIFKISSRFGGGIGRILKDDYVMKQRFFNSIVTGDKSDLFYQNPQGSIVYKISVPRFLKKVWLFEKYVDGKYRDAEFSVIERESLKNLKKYVATAMLDQNNFEDEKKFIYFVERLDSDDPRPAMNVLANIISKLSVKYIHQDYERRLLYKRKKRNAKLQLLISNKVSYSHI